MAKSANLGFPRLGSKREWKKALEGYWAKKLSQEELITQARTLMERHWKLQQDAGIEVIPCGDFSFYDHMLDTAVLVGAVPERYVADSDQNIDIDTYFAMARGRQDRDFDVTALEMTKWFDTNYHYLVPEFDLHTRFRLASNYPFDALKWAKEAGVENPRPVLVGPVTFLLLGKVVGAQVTKSYLLDDLLNVYVQILERFAELGVPWVQIDEPALIQDLNAEAREMFHRAYDRLTAMKHQPKIMLTTYFGGLGENAELTVSLGTEGLHLDLVRAPEQLETILEILPPQTTLSLGVIDGRNIWRADLDKAYQLLSQAEKAVGTDRIQIAASGSLLHVPIDLQEETKLDPEIKEWLAFGVQKLHEVAVLTQALNAGLTAVEPNFKAARMAWQRRSISPKAVLPAVRARLNTITETMTQRLSPFEARRQFQQDRFHLPPLPTTTVGSFPQTKELRRLRVELRKGMITEHQYQEALEAEIRQVIEFQEAVGLDVLVHGEFERTDMVEYFAEQLDGFLVTQNGWVQSYGSRAVKPPIIFGDVQRPKTMTVPWISYAQNLTEKPVKAMLTGPVTMLKWSFVRDDQPLQDTCQQIALAIRDEVADLENAGIGMIQIDEPAFAEGLPARRRYWASYLNWAARAFRLCSSGVRDDTQIHTHMCYSNFADIIESIAALEADVISMEASRSGMDLLEVFRHYRYPNDIGPGVYDIHSPRTPSIPELVELIRAALKQVDRDRLWINPDCGLKTRGWQEVRASLENMVAATFVVRMEIFENFKAVSAGI